MAHRSTAGARRTSGRRRRVIALAALASWATVVPWLARALGLELDVSTRLEIVDHVVPGAVVLASCAVLAHPAAATPRDGLRPLAFLGAATLAGFWITATHAVLLPEAIDGISPWGPALLHLTAGPPVTVLALWMLLADAAR